MLDGVVIVDIFEPLLTGVSIWKVSPCLTLANNGKVRLRILTYTGRGVTVTASSLTEYENPERGC